MNTTRRLPYTTFDIPVPELRFGHYAAVYFSREKHVLEREGKRSVRGLMQVFNKVDGATLCGIDEALALLRLGTGHWKDGDVASRWFAVYIGVKGMCRRATARGDLKALRAHTEALIGIEEELDVLWADAHEALEIHALHDGDRSNAHEALLTIEGPAAEFAHLESVYLGVIARGTRVATNTRRVVEAAAGKPILFFADRFDRWQNQTPDGYAALRAGAFGVATDAMGEWWGIGGLGTIPHALIALYKGDTAAATLAFAAHYPEVEVVSLVDFHNDCVKTSLEVARAFADAGKKLWGVRLDTSATLVDQSVVPQMGQFRPTGVCGQLVENVRKALDRAGYTEVKIVVSGGFTPERIAEFERAEIPVDAYGVGSSLLSGNFDHTADIVMVEGMPLAKVGRSYNPSPSLQSFFWSEIEAHKDNDGETNIRP